MVRGLLDEPEVAWEQYISVPMLSVIFPVPCAAPPPARCSAENRWEMVTGKKPYENMTQGEVIQSVSQVRQVVLLAPFRWVPFTVRV